MLSEDEKSHIMEEESFRQEVRQQLETEKLPPSKNKKFLDFVNTPLALWLLSTVVVGSFGLIYSYRQERYKEDVQKREIQHRLYTETSWRVMDTLSSVAVRESEIGQKEGILSAGEVYAIIIDGLDGIKSDSQRPHANIYNEYRDRSFPSLVFELKSVDENPDLDDVWDFYRRMTIQSKQQRKISSGSTLSNDEIEGLRTTMSELTHRL